LYDDLLENAVLHREALLTGRKRLRLYVIHVRLYGLAGNLREAGIPPNVLRD